MSFFGLAKRTPKVVQNPWIGNYDENLDWTFMDTFSANVGKFGSIQLNRIHFVHGDITSPNCKIVFQQQFGENEELESVRVFYPSSFEMIRIQQYNYQELIELDEFKDAVILCILRESWPHDYEDYYIVSEKEASLYRDYMNEPYNYFIDNKKVDREEFMDSQHKFVLMSEKDSTIVSKGYKLTTFIEERRLTKEENKLYGVLKSDLKKDFELIFHGTHKYELMTHFYTPILIDYFKKEEWEEMLEELKQPHDPYVVKGTNKPPYFKIKDYIVESTTPSWYQFVLEKYFDNKVQDWMLEKM